MDFVIRQELNNPQIISASICTDKTSLIVTPKAQSSYACGYSCFQMLLSALVNLNIHSDIIKLQFNNKIPTVFEIQKMIEYSWSLGYDTIGAQQLQWKLFNTRKWIGATEIMTVLMCIGVPCKLYDFYTPTGVHQDHQLLLEFVMQYFQGLNHSGLKQLNIMPLYLQHSGHARIIVGIEQPKNGNQMLLLFDPSFKTFVRCDLLREKHAQYQIIEILSMPIGNNSKIITSTRIPPLPDFYSRKHSNQIFIID